MGVGGGGPGTCNAHPYIHMIDIYIYIIYHTSLLQMGLGSCSEFGLFVPPDSPKSPTATRPFPGGSQDAGRRSVDPAAAEGAGGICSTSHSGS